MQKLYSSARDLAKYVIAQRYHRIQNRQAMGILGHIEGAKGKTAPELIKASDQYADDVLGWRGYAPWLYVYSAMAERFEEGWIPDNYYGQVVVPAMKGDYGKVSALRSLTNTLFDRASVPDVAYRVNGLYLSRTFDVLREDALKEVLFEGHDRVVFKTDSSLQGTGITLLDRESFKLEALRVLGNGVFQEYIDQHSFFDALMPASVASLRMTTVSDDDGGVSVRACYLRFGRSADSHVQSASHVRVSINTKSGELDPCGYLTTWLGIDRHPDTQAVFAGKSVPCFDTCVSTALDMHASIPHVRCVGWDLVVDKQDKVKVMEWNGEHNDIKFSEATQGPCFADCGWERLWR